MNRIISVFLICAQFVFVSSITLSVPALGDAETKDQKLIDLRVAEAKERCSYYKERVEAAKILLSRVRVETHRRRLVYNRLRTLYDKQSASLDELEEAKMNYDQKLIDERLMISQIKQRESEYRASLTRVDQAKSGEAVIPIP